MSKMWHRHYTTTFQQWKTLMSPTQSGVGGKWKRLFYFIQMNNSFQTVSFHNWSTNNQKKKKLTELHSNSRDEVSQFLPLAGTNTVNVFLMCVIKVCVHAIPFCAVCFAGHPLGGLASRRQAVHVQPLGRQLDHVEPQKHHQALPGHLPTWWEPKNSLKKEQKKKLWSCHAVITQQERLNLQLMRRKLESFDAEWWIHTEFGVTSKFEFLLGYFSVWKNCSSWQSVSGGVRVCVCVAPVPLTCAGSVRSSPPIQSLSYHQTGSLSCKCQRGARGSPAIMWHFCHVPGCRQSERNEGGASERTGQTLIR